MLNELEFQSLKISTLFSENAVKVIILVKNIQVIQTISSFHRYKNFYLQVIALQFIEIPLQHECFPVNFAAYFQNTFS